MLSGLLFLCIEYDFSFTTKRPQVTEYFNKGISFLPKSVNEYSTFKGGFTLKTSFFNSVLY